MATRKHKRHVKKMWRKTKANLIVTCSRGHTHPWRKCKPIRTQHLPDEIIELRNCPTCRTTMGRLIYSAE